MFKSIFVARDAFCNENCIDSSQKDELEDYIEENKLEKINNNQIK